MADKPKKRTNPTARAKRRERVAASVVAGKPISAIAADEGVSRYVISREANAPETRVLIASLIDQHSQAVAALIPEALGAIREAFQACTRQAVRVKTYELVQIEGEEPKIKPVEKYRVLNLGPDHYARLAAAKRLIELLTAGRPPMKEQEQGDKGVATLEDIRAALQAQPVH